MKHQPSVLLVVMIIPLVAGASNLISKYPPAEPGALVLEPLKAACPCRFSSAPLNSKECLTSVCRNNPRKFLAPTLRSSHHFV